MLATVVVLLLVAAFVLVAGVAAWVVRRLWTAPRPESDDAETGESADLSGAAVPARED